MAFEHPINNERLSLGHAILDSLNNIVAGYKVREAQRCYLLMLLGYRQRLLPIT
jgi:hypothetical protein